MILLVALLLSLIVALTRGGSLLALGNVSVRYGWLAIAAFGAQCIEIYMPLQSTAGLWSTRTLLLLGTYGLLGLVMMVNWTLPGIAIMTAGLVLNLVVMLANGGYMPIAPEALASAGLGDLALGAAAGSRLMATKDILLPRTMTRLWFLSDILVIPAPLRSVASIGDVLIAVGVFLFFQRTMVGATVPTRATGPGPVSDVDGVAMT